MYYLLILLQSTAVETVVETVVETAAGAAVEAPGLIEGLFSTQGASGGAAVVMVGIVWKLIRRYLIGYRG